MTYTIDNTTLTNLITEEVSRIAAAARSDDGASMYDSVAIHSRDDGAVSRMIRDAIDSIVKRTLDICTVIPSPYSLSLYAPDMDSTKESMVRDELTRAITLRACSIWLSEKLPSHSEDYSTRADAALQNAVHMLKTRTQPTLV